MANNVTFQDSDLSTPPNATVVQTEDQGSGVQRQVIKVALGGVDKSLSWKTTLLAIS